MIYDYQLNVSHFFIYTRCLIVKITVASSIWFETDHNHF